MPTRRRNEPAIDRELADAGEILRHALGEGIASIPLPDFAAIEARGSRRAPGHATRVVFLAAASVILALGIGLPLARARSSRILLESRTDELVESIFRTRLLEGAELSAAVLLSDPPEVFDRDGELFLRSRWARAADWGL